MFVIKKTKNTIQGTYVIKELNGTEIVGAFYEKGLQRTNQSLELKKQQRKNIISYVLHGNVIIYLIA